MTYNITDEQFAKENKIPIIYSKTEDKAKKDSTIYDYVNRNEVEDIQGRVENDSKMLDEIVEGIVISYCKELDDYIQKIHTMLTTSSPTDTDLENFCMMLSTLIYFAGSQCEKLGIRDDISKAIWKEIYNNARNDYSGTVADKNSYAELSSQQEQLTNICYNRAYKILKSKVDNAQEVLASCKKTLSYRMQEMDLSRMTVNP